MRDFFIAPQYLAQRTIFLPKQPLIRDRYTLTKIGNAESIGDAVRERRQQKKRRFWIKIERSEIFDGEKDKFILVQSEG